MYAPDIFYTKRATSMPLQDIRVRMHMHLQPHTNYLVVVISECLKLQVVSVRKIAQRCDVYNQHRLCQTSMAHPHDGEGNETKKDVHFPRVG